MKPTDTPRNTRTIIETTFTRYADRRQWVKWRPVGDNKVPTPNIDEPNKFPTLTECKGDRIGVVLTETSDLFGQDLDACRNPKTGKITEWAREIIDALYTYTEISPSGTGVKAFLERGDGLEAFDAIAKYMPGECIGKKDPQVEIYTKSRYFTVTGQHLSGTPLKIRRVSPNDWDRIVAVINKHALRLEPGSKESAGRNVALFKLGCSLQGKGRSDDYIRAELEANNRAGNVKLHPNFASGPLPSRDIDTIMRSVLRYEKGPYSNPSAAPHYDPGSEGPVPMGYTPDGRFAFLVRNSVIQMNSTQLLSPHSLIGLAPQEFWCQQFPSADKNNKSGFNAWATGQALIAACDARGPYDPARMRGRGVWREGDRIIVNFGDPVPEDTEFIYLCFKKLKVEKVESFETERLLEMLQIWPWKHKSHVVFYLGWLAYAPVCGALDWRPHRQMYGPKGAGKSALDDITGRLLRSVALSTTGISTAAGIRQELGPDCRPVLIDDADDRYHEMTQIVQLMRMASSSDKPTLRGTPEGRSQRYMPTATFMVSSISPIKMAPQDEDRIVQLELVPHDNDRQTLERLTRERQHFYDRGSDWFGYCVGNVGLLRPSIDAFDLVLAIANQRHRRTLATFLGAAFVALCRRVPSEQEARNWAKEHAGATEDYALAAGDRDDAMEALNHLLYHKPVGEQRALGHHIAMGILMEQEPGKPNSLWNS